MKVANKPTNEQQRIDALSRYQLLDTPEEEAYDDIVRLASYICETPIALVSIVDSERQWFKAKVGLDATETHRDIAFCSHAILQDDVFIVEDASQDERFFDNPLVASDPNIRFYAGAPLNTSDGFPLGTICVIDQESRKLTAAQTEALSALSRQASCLLELRRTTRILNNQNDSKAQFLSVLSHDLGNAFNGILFFAKEIHSEATEADIADMAEKLEQISSNTYEQLKGLLEWAKNEIANVDFKPEELSFEQAISPTIEAITARADEKNISIHTSNLNTTVFADKNMLHSLISNVLSNAVKFSPTAASIELTSTETPTHIKISVTDQGPGFPEDKLEVLAGKTNFATTTGTVGEKGNGLGLNLVHRMMERHKGHIDICNGTDKGTKITLAFPKKSA